MFYAEMPMLLAREVLEHESVATRSDNIFGNNMVPRIFWGNKPGSLQSKPVGSLRKD